MLGVSVTRDRRRGRSRSRARGEIPLNNHPPLDSRHFLVTSSRLTMNSPPLRPTLRSALSSPSTTPGGSHAALPDSAHVQFPDNPATTDRALPRPSGSRNSSFTKTRTLSGDYGGTSKDGYQPRGEVSKE
jgi:hypothetical protein